VLPPAPDPAVPVPDAPAVDPPLPGVPPVSLGAQPDEASRPTTPVTRQIRRA
jgi:hypothetical protein